MKFDNNKFLRRPRPSKLEQIKLQFSSSEDESVNDDDSLNSFEDELVAATEDSNAFNTQRDLASYASFMKPNPKDINLLPPLNQNIISISKESNLKDGSYNEDFS